MALRNENIVYLRPPDVMGWLEVTKGDTSVGLWGIEADATVRIADTNRGAKTPSQARGSSLINPMHHAVPRLYYSTPPQPRLQPRLQSKLVFNVVLSLRGIHNINTYSFIFERHIKKQA
jgi:hypothetical protein